MSFTLTGHPDWQPTQNTPVPVICGTETGLAPGTWGPFSIPVSSGGSYLLALSAVTSGEAGFTDVTIKHLDTAGNTVYVDFFGAVQVGGILLLTPNLMGPVMIRGNIYGSELSISGQVATSSWIDTVFGVTGETASDVSFNAYVSPLTLSEPEPRVSCGNPELVNSTDPIPGGLLSAFDSVGISTSSTAGPFALVPYSGPATMEYYMGGAVTVPTNVLVQIAQYTVAGGTGSFSRFILSPAAMKVGYEMDIDLPACLNLIQVSNNDATNSLTANLIIVAERTA
jgi:hypothetical protein